VVAVVLHAETSSIMAQCRVHPCLKVFSLSALSREVKSMKNVGFSSLLSDPSVQDSYHKHRVCAMQVTTVTG
jgi:hypothetical protein